MSGRYGTDKLNMVILGSGVLVSLIASFIRLPLVMLLLTVFVLRPAHLGAVPVLLPEHLQGYEENRRWAVLRPLEGPAHRYYKCPKCRQSVRVPRGKGKISITCPRCREKFIRKT